MKPYYSDDLVTLYHGDCLEVLADVGNASVDVVLTDPPFFMPATHYSSRTQWQRSWGDTSILASFWRSVVDVTAPTMKPTGHFLAFCDGDSYPVFYPEMYRKFDSLGSIVWDKGRIGMGSPWRSQHELIIAARWAGSFRSEHRWCADVVKASPISSQKRLHPVDKPVALLAELLKPVLPTGGVVLDPFAGGGSTILAAKRAGARSIGIETEERYLEVIAARLAAENAQQAFELEGIA